MGNEKTFGGFLKDEVSATARIFLHTFLRFSLVGAVVIIVLLLISKLTGEAQPGGGDGGPVTEAMVFIVASIYYGIIIGLGAAFIRVAFYLFGVIALLPVVLIPLAMLTAFYLAADTLGEQAAAVLAALTEATAGSLNSNSLPAARIGHPILAVFLLPFLMFGALSALFDPAVLTELAKFSLTATAVALIGLLPATIVSSLVVGVFFFNRYAARYREYIAPTKE